MPKEKYGDKILTSPPPPHPLRCHTRVPHESNTAARLRTLLERGSSVISRESGSRPSIDPRSGLYGSLPASSSDLLLSKYELHDGERCVTIYSHKNNDGGGSEDWCTREQLHRKMNGVPAAAMALPTGKHFWSSSVRLLLSCQLQQRA